MLDTIGELSDSDRMKLRQMTPKLQSIYGVDGDWQTIIASVMHFPDNIQETIRFQWDRNREQVAQDGDLPLAEDFARWITDTYLVPERYLPDSGDERPGSAG